MNQSATVVNERMMNLLYISAEYPPETGYGGIGTYTKHIAEGMVKRGHTVTVIARCDSAEETCLKRCGVEVHRIRPLPHPLPRHRYAYVLRMLCRLLFPHTLTRLSWSLAIVNKIQFLVSRGKQFDIIEAPECGAEGYFITRRFNSRTVIRLHTPWEIIRQFDGLPEPIGDRLLLPLLERRTAKRADAISAPSQAIATLLQRRWRLGEVTVIANPLPALPSITTTKTAWIYTGRIERRKGVHHLIAAFAAVKHERAVPPLKLIGNAYGADRSGVAYGDTLRAMIEAHRLSDDIEWIENAGLDDVARHLNDASVAFFPSLWENFPYACLEAMSCGCAVVTSDCGGLREIVIHEESGLRVKPDSADEIAGAMRRLLDAPEYAERLGRGARERATALTDTNRICGEMELFYRKVAGY